MCEVKRMLMDTAWQSRRQTGESEATACHNSFFRQLGEGALDHALGICADLWRPAAYAPLSSRSHAWWMLLLD